MTKEEWIIIRDGLEDGLAANDSEGYPVDIQRDALEIVDRELNKYDLPG
tara:strand:+ start:1013 stop:1159 length:147 start_codon:yes stop_codon:yes gene_type:complete